MKVLLIDPFYNSGVVPPNWSLGQIETGLKELGIDVSLLDFIEKNCQSGNIDNFFEKEESFIKKIEEETKNYDAVYISSSYGIPLKQMPVFPRIKKIVKNIKKANTSIIVAVGG